MNGYNALKQFVIPPEYQVYVVALILLVYCNHISIQTVYIQKMSALIGIDISRQANQMIVCPINTSNANRNANLIEKKAKYFMNRLIAQHNVQ